MNSTNIQITEKTRKALEFIKNKNNIFMHHSVGENILDGLEKITEESGVKIKFQKVRNKPIPNDIKLANIKRIIDITGGKNGQPKSKIDSFTKQIKELKSISDPEIAFMKFCFVDFNPSTNVNEIFSYYKKKINNLKTEKPNIKFVHLTVPLTKKTNSIKDKINRLLGRQIWEDTSNIRRAEFNELLYKYFSQDPIFDIARIESTHQDGSRSSFEQNGKTYYSLASEYTDDGAHLNALGQQLTAIKIAEFLSKISINN